jgi:hypothetical protein
MQFDKLTVALLARPFGIIWFSVCLQDIALHSHTLTRTSVGFVIKHHTNSRTPTV